MKFEVVVVGVYSLEEEEEDKQRLKIGCIWEKNCCCCRKKNQKNNKIKIIRYGLLPENLSEMKRGKIVFSNDKIATVWSLLH